MTHHRILTCHFIRRTSMPREHATSWCHMSTPHQHGHVISPMPSAWLPLSWRQGQHFQHWLPYVSFYTIQNNFTRITNYIWHSDSLQTNPSPLHHTLSLSTKVRHVHSRGINEVESGDVKLQAYTVATCLKAIRKEISSMSQKGIFYKIAYGY